MKTLFYTLLLLIGMTSFSAWSNTGETDTPNGAQPCNDEIGKGVDVPTPSETSEGVEVEEQ